MHAKGVYHVLTVAEMNWPSNTCRSTLCYNWKADLNTPRHTVCFTRSQESHTCTSTERHSFQAFLDHAWPTVIVVIRFSISFHRRVRFTVRSWRPPETLSARSFIRTLSVVNSQCAIADHVWEEARESVKLKATPSLPSTTVDSEADCLFSQERVVLRRRA